MTRDDLRAQLTHDNVLAFLRVIREGESSQEPIAYRMRFGGHGKPVAYFDDLSKHPRIFEPTRDGKRSSAAGAYQATWTTWSEEQKRYGWSDFSEASQDEFAVARLVFRKALGAVRAGRFDEACRLCRLEWTSLPGGSEPNAATRRARAVYEAHGGRIADEAPVAAPAQPAPREVTMAVPILPIFTAVLPILKDLIPQLGTLFGSGSEVQQRNVAAASLVTDALTRATGSPNLQAAVEAMQADPQARQAAQAAVSEVWPSLVEAGGGGIDGARKVAFNPDQAPPWKNPAVWIAVLIFGLVYMVAMAVLFGIGGQSFSDDLKTLFVTAIVSGALGSVTGFFLGSSLGSQRKDAMLGGRQ